MNIQNNQIAQGLFRAVEVKSGSGKGEISAESNSSLPDKTSSEADLKTVSDSPNATRVYSPPLFPLGHTQGIYDIIPAKSDSSSAASVETKKTSVRQDHTTTNAEDITSRREAASDKDGIIKNNVSAVKKTISLGNVLDLKV